MCRWLWSESGVLLLQNAAAVRSISPHSVESLKKKPHKTGSSDDGAAPFPGIYLEDVQVKIIQKSLAH